MKSKRNSPTISVRAFIENDKGEVLIVKRSNTQNSGGEWSLPGGVVTYKQSPEQSLVSLIKEKTNLNLEGIDFLNYQNSMPAKGANQHCLNMYFKATGRGYVAISNGFSDYVWVRPERLASYNLAFNGNEAIKFYEESKIPPEDHLWMMVDEAGRTSTPITKKMLIDLQAQQDFFTNLEEDMKIYRSVTKKLDTSLEIIKSHNLRNGESIIVQVQSRTKEKWSILEKMIRKGQNGIPRHYTTFDDNSGARAVVSFLKDAYTVADKLSKFPDLNIVKVDDFIKNPRDTGYRALHLTIEVPMPGINFIPKSEMQIKTVLQHTWSNAAHELTYKKNFIPQKYLSVFQTLGEDIAKIDSRFEAARHEIEHLNDPK